LDSVRHTVQMRKGRLGQVRWRVRRYVGKRTYCMGEHATREAAAAAAAALDAAGAPTLAEWFADWCAERKATGARSLSHDRATFSAYVSNTRLGAIGLQSIDAAVCRRWFNALLARNLAPSTVRRTVVLVQRCMAAAVAAGWIPASPAAAIRAPTLGARRRIVYAIRCTVTGLVKLGTADRPRVRFKALATGPTEVVFIAYRDGDVEREVHARFAAQRRRGEWFDVGDAALLEAGFVFASLDEVDPRHVSSTASRSSGGER